MKSTVVKAKKAVKRHITKETSTIDAIIDRVKTYIKDKEEVIDREAIIKYAALAVVAIYGLRKSGFLRGMLLPAIATLVTERLVENIAEKRAA